MLKSLVLLSILIISIHCFSFDTKSLSSKEKFWLSSASRTDINGWIHLVVNGEPYTRGFQYGFMISKEFAEAWDVFDALTYQGYGIKMSFYNSKSIEMHKKMIPQEFIQEMQGIADGITKGGFRNTTLDDIIAWNDYQEMTLYWWPTVQSNYTNFKNSSRIFNSHHKFVKSGHCSAFAATGNATADGKIVISHTTFVDFWQGQYFNVILDLTPTQGNRMVFQVTVGWIASFADFWVTSGGLLIVETSLVNYYGYDTTKMPEWIRNRDAAQYSHSIDEWVFRLNNNNDGAFANSWIVADINSNEIALYEEGLLYQSFTRTKSGYLFSFNSPNDPRIRHLECKDTGYNDVRQVVGARRVRFPQLLNQYYGKINSTIARTIISDTYDPYLRKNNPSSRCICAHFDADPQEYMSDPNAAWNVPFYPSGSIDAKVSTSDAAKSMSMWGIFGRADGVAFDADQFFKNNPQWNWQAPYLKSRPSQPWTYFPGNN